MGTKNYLPPPGPIHPDRLRGWDRLLPAAIWLVIAVCGWFTGFGTGDKAVAGGLSTAEREACLEATGQGAVTRCYDAVRKDPLDSGVRIRLSDALSRLKRYRQAIDVLRDGLELEPENDDIKGRLTRMEQLDQERIWIEKQKQKRRQTSSSGMTSQQRIAAGRFEIRCTKLKGQLALQACNEGLARFPGDPVLYTGKGNALLAIAQYGKAIEAFEDALILNPDDPAAVNGLKKSRALRRVSVKKCLELSGRTALDACSSALLTGSPDEVAIWKRQGDLLIVQGKKQEAVSAYQKALAVDGSDKTIKLKLMALGIEPAAGGAFTPAAEDTVAAGEREPAVSRPVKAPPAPIAPAKSNSGKTASNGQEMEKPPAKTAPVVSQNTPSTGSSVAGDAMFSNALLPSGFTH